MSRELNHEQDGMSKSSFLKISVSPSHELLLRTKWQFVTHYSWQVICVHAGSDMLGGH